MERVTIGKLRDGLSAWLRKVEAGEIVEVMNRDRIVAHLAPGPAPTVPSRPEKETPERKLARLEARGFIRRPREPWDPKWMIERLRHNPPQAARSVVEALIEERDEER